MVRRIPIFYEIDTLLDLLKKHFALKNDPIELLIDKKSENVLDIRMLNFDGHTAQSPSITEEDFRDRCPYLYERMKFLRDKPNYLGVTHNPYDSDELTRHMLIGQSMVVQIPFQKRHEMLLKDPFLVEWFDRACFPYNEDAPITPLYLKILDSLKGNTYLVAAHDPVNPHLGEDKFYAVLGSHKVSGKIR